MRTWSAQHETDVRRERDKHAALYGNPFLLACDELQSRIYNLLSDKTTIGVLKAHYADAEYAEETLYLVLQYFGWERHVFRYGPFSLDPDVIRLTARIRDTFATSKRFPLGAFCFFRTEQRALGESVIEQVATEAGVTQETMLFFSFRESLQHAPLSEVKAIGDTLKALRSATNGDDLEGRDRLAQVQNHLVDLVDYLEGQLGVTLSSFSRGKLPLVATKTAPAAAKVRTTNAASKKTGTTKAAKTLGTEPGPKSDATTLEGAPLEAASP